jgi:Skp family chaperone for outer membrane proteins
MRLMNAVCAAAIVAASVAASPEAAAQRNRNNQSTTVVAVNLQRVLSESAIGRDYSARIGQIRQQITTEAQALQPEQQSVQQEAQNLAQATRNMTADQVRANSSLSSRVQAFNQRRQQLAVREQGLQGDMDCTQLVTLRALMTQITPVVQAAAQQRGAGVIVDANTAIYVGPEYDITSTVIQQLDQNQGTRSATVARHPVTECQAQQPAAGQ